MCGVRWARHLPATSHAPLPPFTAFSRLLAPSHALSRPLAPSLSCQVDDLVVKTLIAAEPTIVESTRAHVPSAGRGEPNRTCFQVFGFDVMLDAHAKPWLLEVNLDPALRTESPLDLKIKSSMLIDALNTVGLPVPPAAPSSIISIS